MNINYIKIPVHSFIDLITNSSTEIYVNATDKTLNLIHNFADSLLLASGSPLKSKSIFTAKLVVTGNSYGSKSENILASSEHEANELIELEKSRRERVIKGYDPYDDNSLAISSSVEIVIHPDYVNNSHVQEMAKALRALGGSYNTTEVSN